MFWVLIFVASVLLFYYFLIKPQLYWKKQNVPQGFPYPLLGENFKSFVGLETTTEMIQNIYNSYKNRRYVGMYQGTLPTLMLRDPELIKQVTVKDFDHFVNHRPIVSENQDPVWNRNLLSLQDEHWRIMRATLSPTFTSSKMRAMFKLMEQTAQQYVNFYLEQKRNTIELEVKDSLTRFANDVIGNCAFGVNVDSLKQPENEFYLKGQDATDFAGFLKSLKFLINFISPTFADFFRIRLFNKSTTEYFKTLVRDTVNYREEKKIHRPDMINLLMEARKGTLKYEESNNQKEAGFSSVEESSIGKGTKTTNIGMSDEDMAAQVFIFFFGGFDTVSTLMSFMCYELATNPDVQKKLIEEIDETFKENDGKLTYDVLNKMKYMDMVVTETLRKNPPFISTDRVCTRPYTIKPVNADEEPVHLRVGDIVLLPMSGIHHDEEYFPNPSKFDPERFSEENKDQIVPYSYIPFGAGPRNCIASRFALMECKTLMFHILNNFEITVIKKTTIPMKLEKYQFNPGLEGGFWLGYQRRQQIR